MRIRVGLAVLVGAGLLGWSPCADACQWFVDGDAEPGGDGTASSPFDSIAQALAAPPSPGDVVCLQEADEPYPGFMITGVDGTAQLPIELAAAPGHAPIIGDTVVVRDVSHWVLRGLTWDGREVGEGRALTVEAIGADVIGLEVRGCTIVHWPNHGVVVGPPQNGLAIRDVVVADNRIRDVTYAGIELDGVDDGEVVGNVVEQVRCGDNGYNSYAGIQLGYGAQRITVAHNTVRDQPECLELEGVHTQGIEVREGAADGEIHHNLIEDIRSISTPSGFAGGISLHDGASRWWVHHNVTRAIGLQGGGCSLCDAADHYAGNAGDDCDAPGCNADNRWEHNTVVDAATGIRLGKTLGTVVSSNVVVAHTTLVQAFRDDAEFTIDHQLYWQHGNPLLFKRNGDRASLEEWQGACECDAASQVADPRLDVGDGVTPMPDGPAIDAAPSLLPHHGAAPDLGALEAPVVRAATVEASDPSRVRLTVESRVAPPLEPLGGCEGLEVQVGGQVVVATGCTATLDEPAGEVTVMLSLLEPLWRDAEATLVHTGTLTDVARIGGRMGARVPGFVLALDTSGLPERMDEPVGNGLGEDEDGCHLVPAAEGPLGLLGLVGLLALGWHRRPKNR
ncbi:right-handed parallel beta-helix repeat-containing protein [Paraliomyxa miuraensis]|uniref:right-handed parallel beta-helix repeat-containing protein n=1 Tax=Paraliomyxa miuraensis TaxID=376150 RepID=UPI002253031F|nr:right-handed parallel beta-helix repeat-containing protein [Paraliomyxa miuraensis]MCX4241658.1 right-handed parallel beta-helix repeat-containing protein [Paraliomyxa miuraensis]